MNQKVTHIFETLEQAKIPVADFSKLTGISRPGLQRWKTGGNVTDRLRLNIAYSTSLRISKAVSKDLLPLKNKLKAPQRVATLRKIISAMAA